MAKTNPAVRYYASKFLKTTILTVLAAVFLSRCCYVLYSATYYNSAVNDTLFNLIYHLCGTVFAAWRGIAFGLILCAFFYVPEAFWRTVGITVCGSILFQASAVIIDWINKVLTDPLSTALYSLLLILEEFLLETLVLILILSLAFRQKRTAQPIVSLFSRKNSPQFASLIFSAVYFAECLFAHISDIVSFFRSASAVWNAEVAFEIVGRIFEAALNGFVIPYTMISLIYLIFEPKNTKN